MSQVVVPDIPHEAVKLKIDGVSNNIRIDEESLLRSLSKLRTYVKDATDSALTVLRGETEAQVKAVRKETELAREASAGLEGKLAEQMLRLSTTEEEMKDLKAVIEKLSDRTKNMVAKHDRGKFNSRGSVSSMSLVDPPDAAGGNGQAQGPPNRASAPSPVQEGAEADSASRLEETRHQSSNASPASPQSEGHPDTVQPNAHMSTDDGVQKPPRPETPDKAYASMRSQVSPESDGMGEGMNLLDDCDATEAFQAAQDVAMQVQQGLQDLESNIDRKLAAISEDLESAAAERRSILAHHQSRTSILDDHMGATGASMQKMNVELKELRQRMAHFETDDSTEHATRETQGQIMQLQERLGQAALAHVVEPKIDKLGKQLELQAQACLRSDKDLEDATQNVSHLYVKLDSCSQQLSQMPQRAEFEDRFLQLDQRCRNVNSLLKEVETALGDISGAIVSLSSKAEQSDLAVIRDELSMFAESIKDKAQSVLFGARCLSCNRVFDEVSQENGAVDLPMEKQRDALFAQVQRALHSPSMDPMAKIKMLAVKVGRPSPVPSKGGPNTFYGRDESSFACGTSDMQLVPAVRGCSVASGDGRISAPPQRPGSTTPRPKRRAASRNDAWHATSASSKAQDGPMDYTHPLSQLLDRSQRSGRYSALG